MLEHLLSDLKNPLKSFLLAWEAARHPSYFIKAAEAYPPSKRNADTLFFVAAGVGTAALITQAPDFLFDIQMAWDLGEKKVLAFCVGLAAILHIGVVAARLPHRSYARTLRTFAIAAMMAICIFALCYVAVVGGVTALMRSIPEDCLAIPLSTQCARLLMARSELIPVATAMVVGGPLIFFVFFFGYLTVMLAAAHQAAIIQSGVAVAIGVLTLLILLALIVVSVFMIVDPIVHFEMAMTGLSLLIYSTLHEALYGVAPPLLRVSAFVPAALIILSRRTRGWRKVAWFVSFILLTWLTKIIVTYGWSSIMAPGDWWKMQMLGTHLPVVYTIVAAVVWTAYGLFMRRNRLPLARADSNGLV